MELVCGHISRGIVQAVVFFSISLFHITMPFDNITNSQHVQSSAASTNEEANTKLTAGTRAEIDNTVIFHPIFKWGPKEFSATPSFFATRTARDTLLNELGGIDGLELARGIISSFASASTEINRPGSVLQPIGTEARATRLKDLEETLKIEVNDRFMVHDEMKDLDADLVQIGFYYAEDIDTVIATAKLCGFRLEPISITDIEKAGRSVLPELRRRI